MCTASARLLGRLFLNPSILFKAQGLRKDNGGGPLVPILAEVDWRASEEFNFHARPDEVERGRRTKGGRGAEEAHTRFSVDGNGRVAMAVRGISSLFGTL